MDADEGSLTSFAVSFGKPHELAVLVNASQPYFRLLFGLRCLLGLFCLRHNGWLFLLTRLLALFFSIRVFSFLDLVVLYRYDRVSSPRLPL